MSTHAPSSSHGSSTSVEPPIIRQVVSFTGFQLDPAFRRLDADTKARAAEEFAKAVETLSPGMICLSYSTVGLKASADLMLWRIAQQLEDFQSHQASLNRTTLGAYMTTGVSYLSMTKRSMYIDKVDPFHTAESRTRIVPGRRKYLFIYPFVKTRDWYLLPQAERQRIMDEHIRVGNKYPSVKLNTTYSFGLDDQDFVVAFECDQAKDFLDLVQDLRETESSKFTVRDTPMYTCVQMPVREILKQLF